MFGMGNNKKEKKGVSYFFDLEKDLTDPKQLRMMKQKLEERVLLLKNTLRQGEDKKHFDQTQTLLHGYLALQKVVQRVNRKSFQGE